MKRSPIGAMSERRRRELAEAGNATPFSTFTNAGAGLSRTAADRDRKPAPKRKLADTGPDRGTVATVVARDFGRCARCGETVRGGRGQGWSVQHRRARGSGGTVRVDTNEPQNLILLCGSATSPGGCHLAVESSKTAARPHGWAIWLNEDPAEVPVDHAAHGWVLLNDAGSWTATSNPNQPTNQEVSA